VTEIIFIIIGQLTNTNLVWTEQMVLEEA